MICDRCFEIVDVWIMSKFNTDEICLDCQADEKLAPGYQAAAEIERSHCLQGDYNFPGVGLSEAAQRFLQDRLALRPEFAEEGEDALRG